MKSQHIPTDTSLIDRIKELMREAEQLSASIKSEALKPIAFKEAFRALLSGGIISGVSASTGNPLLSQDNRSVYGTSNIKRLSLPEFMRRCQVTKDTEKFTAILYHIEKYQGKQSATLKEIVKAWSDGKLSNKPTNPTDVKARAVKNGYVTDGTEPGTIQVTIDGEALIESKLHADHD